MNIVMWILAGAVGARACLALGNPIERRFGV